MTTNVDFDRILEGWLLNAGPSVPDESVVQGAIDEVRTTPRRRGLASILFGPTWWPAGRGRLRMVGQPPLRLVAVAILAMLLVATALIAGGVVQRSALPPSPSPSAMSSPSAAAVVQGPVDDPLRATWLADSRGIPDLQTGSGPVSLSISPDGTFVSMDNFTPGAAFRGSVGQLGAGRIETVLGSDSGGCSRGDAGTYDWRLSDDGSEVTFTSVVESCATRAVALGRTWIRSLVKPTSAGAGIVDTMQPHFFVRLPDASYEARTLDDFIEIGTANGFSLMVFKNPQGFADPCSTDEARYPYTPGAKAVVDYFKQNDAWTILENGQLEVDGHPAVHLVTEAKANYARCPGRDLYMYTPQSCLCHFIANPGGRDTHYLVDVGIDTFMFVLSGERDAETEQAIVKSIRIPENLPSE